MARKIHALLVGIDDYPTPVRPLHGCVNDIQQIHTLLEARSQAAGDEWKAEVLTNAAATRAAIIAGFREHLAKVAKGDVALFYFSGHGSQQPSPPEFWHLEPDRLDETLVCYDSRVDAWDLADKELAQLIAEVAAKEAHVVVILDCCHSGSGTRNAESTGIRRVPTDDRPRPLATFLDGLQIEKSRAPAEGAGWIALPQGRHIVLAACRSDEEAKEYSLGGKPRGVFSHFLTETLQQSSGAVTYRDLFKRINALVRNHAALQSPQMEATEHAMLEENFLGGEAGARGQYFTLSHDAKDGWNIDAGGVHGIPQPAAGGETTVFAIFPQASTPEQWRDLQAALGTARVVRAAPHRSLVQVTLDAGAPAEDQTYKALLIALPLPALEVQFTGDAAALALARAALQTAGAGGAPSLLIREATGANASHRLDALAPGLYRISRPVDGQELVGDVKSFTVESARRAIGKLEHIARWTRISELRNPATRLSTENIGLEIYTVPRAQADTVQPVAGGSLRMSYTHDGAAWVPPSFSIKLENRTTRALYFSLIGLTQVFGVQTDLLPGGCVRLAPGEATWANNGELIYGEVSDPLWKAGVTETRDVLQLIVSTEECDVTLLEQGDLDHPVLQATRGAGAKAVGAGVQSTLNRLLDRVQTRGLSTKPPGTTVVSDWTAQQFTLTTVRPQESIAVSKAQPASLAHGVTIESHPSLDARARLTTAPLASRDAVGGFALPPLLRDDPTVSQPFLLTASRGGEPGLSVLELFDIANHEAVTPANPLKLKIAQPLAPGEHLLPISHDGEFYLPIGRGIGRDGHIEVVLDALPKPVNTRSLFSAVRIYFQKVISHHFGTEYQYPLLAAFSQNGGAAEIISDPAGVRAKVGTAKKIALYIHGIIGETRGMAESAAGLAGPPPIPGLRERYDLVLTFDYENLHTSIEENARLLKERLAAAGLGPGHGRTLHLIAHSMGGLISRWFIEREGGRESVQHLVMLGTPNGGSPWATIEDLAVAALSLGLNGLAPVAWPAQVLGHLVAAVEKIDVALDQMHPASDFLKKLHESDDPKIPYTIIAGNTSLIPAAVAPEKAGLIARLLHRLKSQNLLHLATAPAFFGEDNDIAVSVANIKRLPANHTPPVQIREVPCDHVTYFSTEAGLRALAELLP